MYVGPTTGEYADHLSTNPLLLFALAVFVTVAGSIPIAAGYKLGDTIGTRRHTQSRLFSGILSFVGGMTAFVVVFLAAKALFESGMYGQRHNGLGFLATIAAPMLVSGVSSFAIALLYRKPRIGYTMMRYRLRTLLILLGAAPLALGSCVVAVRTVATTPEDGTAGNAVALAVGSAAFLIGILFTAIDFEPISYRKLRTLLIVLALPPLIYAWYITSLVTAFILNPASAWLGPPHTAGQLFLSRVLALMIVVSGAAFLWWIVKSLCKPALPSR